MIHIFEVTDKTGRKIRLTRERWSHIRTFHGEIENHEDIMAAINNSDKIIKDERENVLLYFKYFKHKRHKSKYMKVAIKYLNNIGFVLSAYFVRNIR